METHELALRTSLAAAATVLLCSGCGGRATLPVSAGIGPNPQLPAPDRR